MLRTSNDGWIVDSSVALLQLVSSQWNRRNLAACHLSEHDENRGATDRHAAMSQANTSLGV